jgi:hypothetical protein
MGTPGIASVSLPPFKVINLVLVQFDQAMSTDESTALAGTDYLFNKLRAESPFAEVKILP